MKQYISTLFIVNFVFSLLCFSQDSITNTIDGKGLKQGIWKTTWSDNETSDKIDGYAIGKYFNDKKEGVWVYYKSSNAIIRRIIYKDDEPFTIVNTYSAKGTDLDGGSLREGKGTLKEYYLNDVLRLDCNFDNGKLDGVLKRYDSKGNIIVLSAYSRGVKHGVEIQYKNQKPFIEKVFQNGLSENYERVYTDGVITSEIIPVSDSVIKVARYFLNGYPKTITFYKKMNGKTYKFGIWRYYDESGFLNKEIHFNGTAGGNVRFFKDKKLLKEEKFSDSNEIVKNSNVDW